MKKLQRAFVVLIAIAVAGIAPLVGLSPAQAASTGYVEAGSAPTTQAALLKGKPTTVTIKFKCVQNCKRFTFVGKVTGAKRKIVLQRSNSENGAYKPFKKIKTKKNGSYHFGALNKQGSFRVFAPPTKKFNKGMSKKIQVTKGA